MAPLLQEVLGSAPDESAVLSICAVPDSGRSGSWLLRHGTLLIVPQACAQTSWAEWRRDQGDQGGPEIDRPLPASFCLETEGSLFARAVLDPEAANDWLERALAGRSGSGERVTVTTTLPGVDPVPALRVELVRPDALVRVLPGTDAPSSVLLAGLKRPAQALLWPCSTEEVFPEPARVELAGQTLFLPAVDLTGIHVIPPSGVSARTTPCGLLVGRAERRAWIRGARGSGDFESFLAELGWEPERIDLADLELTHEEYFGGELVASVRIRLDDLDTSAVDDRGRCQVTLPTLGRKVAHGLALHTIEGELLDRSGPYPIVERIEMSLEVNGHKLPPILTGLTDPPPKLEERLDRRERITQEIEEVSNRGVQRRMIADREIALARLRGQLGRARGELLVLDRYFGQDTDDWRLLDDVSVPVRVLTGKIAQDQPPTIASHVQARFRRKAPLHERVYIWEGGGLSVGGSPTTFGQGPVRITRMSPAELNAWRAEFEALWNSGLYTPVLRGPG